MEVSVHTGGAENLMVSRANKIRVAKDFRIYSRGVKKGTGLSVRQYGIREGIDMKKSYQNMIKRVR